PAVTLAIAAEGGGIACQHRLQLEGCRAGQGAQGGGVTGHPDLEVQHAQAAGEGAVLDGQGLDAVAGDDLQLAGEDAAAVDQRPGQQHGHPGAAADREQGVGCVHPVDVPGPGGEQPFEGGEVVAGAERRGEVSDGQGQLLAGADGQCVLRTVLAAVVDACDGDGHRGPAGAAPQQGAVEVEALDAPGGDVVGAGVGQSAPHPQPPVGEAGDESPAGLDAAQHVLGDRDEGGHQGDEDGDRDVL